MVIVFLPEDISHWHISQITNITEPIVFVPIKKKSYTTSEEISWKSSPVVRNVQWPAMMPYTLENVLSLKKIINLRESKKKNNKICSKRFSKVLLRRTICNLVARNTRIVMFSFYLLREFKKMAALIGRMWRSVFTHVLRDVSNVSPRIQPSNSLKNSVYIDYLSCRTKKKT